LIRTITGTPSGWGTAAANQIRGYKNKVRLHELQGLQPAAAGFVCVEAVSNRRSPNDLMRPTITIA